MAISQPTYPVQTNNLVTHVGSYVDAQDAAHLADTTAVHGIADTSALATTAATSTAISSAVNTHVADTTAVHGIADTSKVAIANVFSGSWPARPSASVVLWIGGDTDTNSPAASMSVGDLWFPAS